MTPVWGLDEHVVPFVARICDLPRGFGECRSLGVLNGRGDIVAGIVFHNWSPEAGVIEVSCGATDRRWATRHVLRTGFGYAFDLIGCQMVVGRTHEKSAAVRRLWAAFGADEYIIPRMRGRAASEAVTCLTQEAWAASKFMR